MKNTPLLWVSVVKNKNPFQTRELHVAFCDNSIYTHPMNSIDFVESLKIYFQFIVVIGISNNTAC
jgi:hypothetical protein